MDTSKATEALAVTADLIQRRFHLCSSAQAQLDLDDRRWLLFWGRSRWGLKVNPTGTPKEFLCSSDISEVVETDPKILTYLLNAAYEDAKIKHETRHDNLRGNPFLVGIPLETY